MFSGGYKTKKDLKAAVGKVYRGYDTSAFASDKQASVIYHVGPSEYERKWYAQITLDGERRIVKVK